MSKTILRQAVRNIFAGTNSSSTEGWANSQQDRGNTVDIFRRYAAGDHRASLTDEMRRLLRISGSSQVSEFTDNYMGIVIQTMADRLEVNSIVAENETATGWIKELLRSNSFDGLQTDIHEATIRDGDTFLMIDWNESRQQVRFTHEPAYDGVNGMIAVYINRKMVAAIKIWSLIQENNTVTSSDDSDSQGVTYINIYFPNHIEKYISIGGGDLRPRPGEEHQPWVDKKGQPLGIPIVHFSNRRHTYADYGASEIEPAIPLQDALNRTLYSMVMAAELTAFQIRYAVGWQPPAAITPGMWIEISPNKPLVPDEEEIKIGVMEQGQIQPYIEQSRHLKFEIFDVTNTPRNDAASANASAESLKQREIGLLGKLRRFQRRTSGDWELAIMLAEAIQTAFGEAPPAYSALTVNWRDPEVRDEINVMRVALEMRQTGVIDQRTFLKLVSPIFSWNDEEIQVIMDATQQESELQLATLGGNIPGFDQLTNPLPPTGSGI